MALTSPLTHLKLALTLTLGLGTEIQMFRGRVQNFIIISLYLTPNRTVIRPVITSIRPSI
jgi:hypothetical protein